MIHFLQGNDIGDMVCLLKFNHIKIKYIHYHEKSKGYYKKSKGEKDKQSMG